MRFTIVLFGSDEYRQTTALRERILRVPIGLKLRPEDVEGEEGQLHLAAFDDADEVRAVVLLKPLEGGVMKLRQMAVCDTQQGRGLGALLVRFAEEQARSRGFHTMELASRIHARGFYERLGYTASGDEFLDVLIPHIMMARRL